MKTCSKCALSKPESDYFVKDRNVGRLHAHCKDCYRMHRKTYSKLHYEKYGEDYRLRARNRRLRLKNEFRSGILSHLKDNPCALCGESDVSVLEFDHITPTEKTFNISQAVRLGYSWNEVLVEIKKCRVLCSNCHKRQTSVQFNWYKNI